MKNKFITKIIGATLAFAMMIGGAVGINAAKQAKEVNAAMATYKLTIDASDFNTTSYAANNNEKTSNAVCTTDSTKTYEVKWTSNQVMKNSNNMQWKKSEGYIYNSTDLGTITNVTVTSSAGSFTTYYGTTEHPTSGTTVGNGFFTVKVGSATGTTSKVEVTFNIDAGAQKANVSLSCDDLNLDVSDPATALVVTATSNDEPVNGLTYTYSVANPNVATVSNTGEVMPVGIGQTQLTINFAGNNDYNAASKTINVVVSDRTQTVSDLTFTAACGGEGTADDGAKWTVTSDGKESTYDSTSGIHYGTGSANVTYLQLATTDLKGDIKQVVVNARDAQATAAITVSVGGTAFTCSGSSTATNTSTEYTFTGNARGEIVVRVDRGESMSKALYVKSIVVAYSKINLTGISLSGTYQTTFQQGDSFNHDGMVVTASYDDDSNENVTSQADWSNPNMNAVGQQQVTVTYKGETAQYNINIIEAVTYTISGTIANGSLSSTANIREGNPLNINIVANAHCTLPTTLISVAMGGNTLTAGSEYTYNNENGAFSIASVTGNVVINAACTKNTGYFEDVPFTVAGAKAAIDAQGSAINDAYVSGIISQIDSYDSTHNSITYWISDDGLTANQFEVYSGKGIDGADFSSVDEIVLGAEVVVKGQIKKYNDIYEFNYNNELVSYTVVVRHTVTFDTGLGSSVAQQLIAHGQTVSQPANPTRASDETYNYTFGGWYVDPEFNGEPYNFNTPVEDDLTLHAKWNASLIPAKDVVESTLSTSAALSYSSYDKQGNGAVDTLNRELTGVTGTNYTDWEDITVSSGVVYAGQSAGGNNSIQLRTKNNNSGIVVTSNETAHFATKVTVSWNNNTASGRSIEIFGKNTAYENATDLYDANKRGTSIGTIVYGTSTELEISNEYKYIGIKASDALYLNSIDIQWGELPTYTYSDLKIRFAGKISEALWTRLNSESTITGYGMLLTTTDVIGNDSIADYYDAAEIYTSTPNVKSDVVKFTNTKATPNLSDGYYGWSLHKSISATDYTTTFIAVAYIETEDDGIIFLDEIRASAKNLAGSLIQNGTYEEDAFGGSLKYLADR